MVGLGGGGSHVVQQLAHLGVGKFVPVDDDIIERKNLNRLLCGTAADAKVGRAKTEIAERVITSINLDAIVSHSCAFAQKPMSSPNRRYRVSACRSESECVAASL